MAENIKPAPVAPSGKNPLLTLLMVVNILAMGTVAYFQYRFMDMEAKRPDLTQLLKEKDSSVEATTDATSEQKVVEIVKKENLLPLDSFTVNLAQGEARKPQIRDTIISILNTKRAEDLLKKEGKSFLKEEIKASINAFLVDGSVEDIYYISFQIN
jgi:flagellar FliL protein